MFDLLGDLYTVPIDGGRARRLTSGPALDVQPKFSPDGRRIAFTSDRGGGDNVWVLNSDGSDPRAVTKENVRLLNGPAWTPDGQYLLARKHITGTRSAGAGEVWMYHASGGEGLRLTEHKNDQQDQGNEITVSRDGRYVYFSEDLTTGPTFRYNKDPNAGIYGIRRLDRETGKVETVVAGVGGAARPTLSPDGESLAFVRRVRGKSVLYVYEMESGTARPLFDGLDPDQQDIWAIFGVYPAMAWTADGRSIVFWAGGKINRIDVASREVTLVPFEAEVEQTITEALRFPVAVHADRHEARMITDAVTSPDGTWLVFHAVGSLWKKQLPDGIPLRLTDDDHRFEYEPDFSPDGQTIVYTAWNDEELSTIRAVPLRGGPAVQLSTRKGYYHEPRFAPDGQKIVFRRGSGTDLLGYAHGTAPGLYWMPASGGEAVKIRDEGQDARFDHTGQRIYFRSGSMIDKSYGSVDLNGGNERTHFKMKYVERVVPSPDGRWVAFTELFNVYVMPFPRTGSTIDLSREQKGLPVTRVSHDAGTNVHWSGESNSLHWTIGPTYVSQTLDHALPFLQEDPDVEVLDVVGVEVGLHFDADVPEGSIAFVGARIVTMDGDEVIDEGTVVVEGNRIAAVGPASDVVVPAGAHRVDVGGKTIIPGLVDVHAHARHHNTGPSPQQNWAYYANLAFGVTTMHDPSANTEFVFRQSELQKAGRIVAPRIFSTGSVLYGADREIRALVDSLEDARSHIRRLKAVGAFSVKSYNQPRRDQRQQILAAGRELGVMVVPEGGATYYNNLTQIIDGHTGIEHNLPVAPLYQDVIELWRHTKVAYTPTLIVNYGGPMGEYYWYDRTNVWENERLLAYTPRTIVDARSRRATRVPDEEYHHFRVAAQAKKLVDQGNLVQLGAHGQMQGLGAHWELWSFEQGGMTPHEALRSATLHGAQYLGLDGDIGTLEEGKLADLVVVDGNPLEDLSVSERVDLVMVNGRLFEGETMNQMGNHPSERRPFYWQHEGVDDRFIWLPAVEQALEETYLCPSEIGRP